MLPKELDGDGESGAVLEDQGWALLVNDEHLIELRNRDTGQRGAGRRLTWQPGERAYAIDGARTIETGVQVHAFEELELIWINLWDEHSPFVLDLLLVLDAAVEGSGVVELS